MVAGGTISVGDNVRASDTAGRVVVENSITPSFAGSALAAHGHTALKSGGADTTLGAHQSVVDGTGADTTLQVGVDTAGQAAVNVPTSSDSGGTPSGSVSAVGHGRIVGKALANAGAGDLFEILVCLS